MSNNSQSQMYQRVLTEQQHFSFRFITTYICTQRCDYCHVYTEEGQEFDRPKHMTLDIAKKALDTYAEFMTGKKHASLSVSFYGGESMTNEKMLFGALEYGNTLIGADRMNWILNTNGTMLTPERALFLKNQNVDVHFSIDGPTAEQNRYRKWPNGKPSHEHLLKALALLKECNHRLQFDSCLTDANLHHLPELVDLAAENGADRIYLAVTDQIPGNKTYNLDYAVAAQKIAEAVRYARTKNVFLGGPWRTALFSNHSYSKQKNVKIPHLYIDTTGLMYLGAYMENPLCHVEELKKELFSDAFNAVENTWAAEKKACPPCDIKSSCNSYLKGMVMYHTGGKDGFEKECHLAKSILDRFPIIYGGAGQFSDGAKLVASSACESYQDQHNGASYIYHRRTKATVYTDYEYTLQLLALFKEPICPAVLYQKSQDHRFWPTVIDLMHAELLLPEGVDDYITYLERTFHVAEKARIETDDFVFFYSQEDKEQVEHHKYFFEEAVSRLMKKGLVRTDKKLLVYAVMKQRDLKPFWGDAPLPKWVKAFVTGRRMLVVDISRYIADENSEDYIQGMMHELTHILLGLRHCHIPIWLEEGLCEYFGRAYDHESFKKIATKQPLYSFHELESLLYANFLEVDDTPIRQNMCYKQALSFTTFCINLKGRDQFLNCVWTTEEKHNFRECFHLFYDMTLDDAEKQWLETLTSSEKRPEYRRLKPATHLNMIEKDDQAIFYNSLFGGTYMCSTALTEIFDFMQNGKTFTEIYNEFDIDDFDSELRELYHKKLLVYTDQSEHRKDSIETRKNEITAGGLIDSLRLTLTRGCNLACTYCYIVNEDHDKTPMSWDTAKKAIDAFMALQKQHKHTRATIRFFGGEPILNWDVLSASLDYIDTVKDDVIIDYFMNTNATLITAEMAEKLAHHKVDIIISIDGPQKVHDAFRPMPSGKGSFAETEKAIKICLEKKCRVSVDTTLGDHNYDSLHDLIDHLASLAGEYGVTIPLGFQSMTMGFQKEQDTKEVEAKADKLVKAFSYAKNKNVMITGLVTFPYQRLFSSYQRGTYCKAAGKELAVEPDEKIFPCAALKIELGTLDALHEVFEKKEYLDLARRGAQTIPECQGCEIEVYCAGGCIADAAEGTNVLLPTKNCAFEKAFFKAMVKEFVLQNEGDKQDE